MSFAKTILYSKEKRKKNRQSKVSDLSCQEHTLYSCCKSNRLHSNLVRQISAEEQLRDYMKE